MKRRSLLFFSVLALLVWHWGVSTPTTVHALSHGCAIFASFSKTGVNFGYTGSFNAGEVFTVTADGPFDFTVNGSLTAHAVTWATYTIPATGSYGFNATSTPPDPLKFAFRCSASGGGGGGYNAPIPPFNQGQINWGAQGTSAISCLGDGSVRVYVPGAPNWRVAFDASPAELASVPRNPAQNTLIKSGNGAQLYRLVGGALQVNTPALEPSKGEQSFIFQDCPIPGNQPSSGTPANNSANSTNAAPSFQLGAGSSFGK